MSDTLGEPTVSPAASGAALQARSGAHAPSGVRAKVRIGSQVVAAGSEEQIGTVEKVAISPKTHQVTHLLVHRGPLPLLHHDIMTPIDAVKAANETTVQLSVPVDVLNRMGAHDSAGYVTPGQKWQAPEGYGRGDALFALPRSGDELDQLLPRGQGRTASTQAEPEGVLLGPDTKVEAGDGPIGSIDRVLLDSDTGRVTHFVVRKGQLLAKHIVVPVDWASEITPERVRLAVDREQLDSLPEYRPDDEIAEGVLQALSSYPPLRRLVHGIPRYEPVLSTYEEDTVRVMVQDGVVILEGNVQSGGQASMAAWLARQVPGVRQVRNLLVADEDLEIAVASALARDQRTRPVRARVEAHLGTVTLTGQAPNEEARSAAEKIASEVHGVRRVADKLHVKAG